MKIRKYHLDKADLKIHVRNNTKFIGFSCVKKGFTNKIYHISCVMMLDCSFESSYNKSMNV